MEPLGPQAPYEWLGGHARNVYSQNGEDGLLAALFARLPAEPDAERWCCEVGAGDGRFCSNTLALIDEGWHAVLIERDPEQVDKLTALHRENPRVVVIEADVVRKGLDRLLHGAGAPRELDLLVIDVDGPDYHVWNGLLHYMPRVVIIEFSPRAAADYIPPAGGGILDQAGVEATERLAHAKGYQPVVQCGCNLICVRKDLAPALAWPLPVAAAADGRVRLNLGAGEMELPGFINIDRRSGGEVYPLPYADASVDEVRASHVLEHFGHHQVMTVLREWVRVLKPGGLIRVAVPDFAYVARAYIAGETMNAQGYVMGGQTDENDAHHCIFDEPVLRRMLREAGCDRIERWTSEIRDCASLPVSLNLQARKQTVSLENIGRDVFAVMSCPRLAFTDNLFCMSQALGPLGIPAERMTGAFWGHCLAALFERHLDRRYILTLDYDSVYTSRDVEDLYRLMEEHPEVGAVFALQQKRENEHPLFVVRSRDGQVVTEFKRADLEEELVPVAQGHFGLTLLRVEALQRVPRPWFQAVPDKEGRWSDESIDEDIDFWRRWGDCGNTLCLAPRVVIGHMQLVVTWPGRDMRAVHQYVGAYNRDGKPAGVWGG